MTAAKYRAQFERTSFGTAKAKAARGSVTAAAAAVVVARSKAADKPTKGSSTKSGG